MATDPTSLPALAEIQQSKKDMADINTFVVSDTDNFTDNTGRLRKTMSGIYEESAKSRGFRVKGEFSKGFTFELYNDVGIDEQGNAWTYEGVGTPYKVVEQGTTPSNPEYQQRTFNAAENINFLDGSSLQEYKDYDVNQDEVLLESFGGGGNGKDNIGAFASVKSTGKVLRLLGDVIYYFSGSRPDLTGVKIRANNGATIRVDSSPDIKDMELLTDVTIENTIHNTTLVKHKNAANELLVAAGASIKRDRVYKPEKVLFSDPSVELTAISGIDTKATFTGNFTDTVVSWGSDFASAQEGVLIDAEEGYLYEVAIRQIGTATTSNSSFRGATILTSVERIDFAVLLNQELAKEFRAYQGTTVTEFPLPYGSYSLLSSGAITAGVRYVGKTVEFYINGTLFRKRELLGTVEKVGFLTSWLDSNSAQINNLTKTKTITPVSSSPVKLAIIGDSISYGAWASSPYDDVMSKTMSHAGLGNVETINYGVSSSATSNWISGGSIDITTKDFTGVDYALVMLGTNDVQGSVLGSIFEANMRNIISYLQGIGVTPVLGVFPMWVTQAITGTGVNAVQYEKGGWHRQLVKYIAADLDLHVADVCAHIGDNVQWLGDNLHPTEDGQIAVASAFAEAVISDKSGGFFGGVSSNEIEPETGFLTISGGWSAISGNQPPQYTIVDGVVTFSGSISGGSLGATFAGIPESIRPTLNRSFSTLCLDSSSNIGVARITVNSAGTLSIPNSNVVPVAVFLDNLSYYIN